MRVYSINLMRNNFLIKYKQEIDFTCMQNKILKEGKDKTEKKSTKRKQEWDGKKKNDKQIINKITKKKRIKQQIKNRRILFDNVLLCYKYIIIHVYNNKITYKK